MLKNDLLDAWDRENFFHPSTHLGQFARGEAPNRIMTGGKGVHVEDRDGTRLLDAFAGLYCVNVGYGRTEIAEAIAKQAKELAYYHSYVGHGTEASITLAKMILERAPDQLERVDRGRRRRRALGLRRSRPSRAWRGRARAALGARGAPGRSGLPRG